jgi:cytochrome d ubiquinol oxidase subunit II
MILSELLDYETLRIIWWVLLGVLLIGFAAMDGFDLGVDILMPLVGKTDVERRVIINTIGPVWEGDVRHPLCPHSASGRFQIPLEA